MPGPLPNPQSRRRNAPTIAPAVLPAAGRGIPAPECPYPLGAAGAAWWEWAWSLPQATRWDAGALYVVARRARLEDRVDALEYFDGLDLVDLFADGDFEARRRVEWALGTLKGLATGVLQVEKEMGALDDRLGLNAKAMAALRWTIEEGAAPAAKKPAEVRRLRAVDAKG